MNNGALSKGHRIQHEGAPTGQRWDSLTIKKEYDGSQLKYQIYKNPPVCNDSKSCISLWSLLEVVFYSRKYGESLFANPLYSIICVSG